MLDLRDGQGEAKDRQGKRSGKGEGGVTERAGVEGGWGDERERDSDMVRDECDPLDNSPMLVGLSWDVLTMGRFDRWNVLTVYHTVPPSICYHKMASR